MKLIIIGGGASGGIALLKSLLQTACVLEVTIVDPDEALGLGRAYSTTDMHHLLNVPADKMSIFQNHPMDFVDWLDKHHRREELDSWPFVPRKFFGEYLQEKIKELPVDSYHHERARVKSIRRVTDADGFKRWAVTTSTGNELFGDQVILATGYEPTIEQKILKAEALNVQDSVIQPYDFSKLSSIGVNDDVLIVGTGLTAMDVLVYLHTRTTGQIQFISRHAFFPKPHSVNGGNASVKTGVSIESLPMLQAQSPRKIFQVFRERYRRDPESWIAIIQQFREQGPDIWQHWSKKEKNQFIRHLKSYWEVARHRLPFTVHQLLETLTNSGRVKIFAGRIARTQKIGKNLVLSFLPRGESTLREIRTAWIVMATDAKIAHSIEGLKSCDLGMGYVETGAPNLYFLGPPAKSKVWESTAVPEIVKQADEIMDLLKPS